MNDYLKIDETEENGESEMETALNAENEKNEMNSFLSTGHFSIHHQPDDDESFTGE